MWKLTIEDDEGKRTPLPLARDDYTIGRGEDNTVRLTERNISRKHGAMRRMASGWLFLDASSYNGSYANGTRIVTEHIISNGDVIQLGDYRLEFVDEELTAKSGEAPNASTIPGGGAAAVKPDRLVVVIGPEPGVEFVIHSATIVLGRAPEADVCLAHSSVSRLHAEIHALGGGRYEILDKASANGVRVNGSLLKRGLLEAGDFIDLGELKLKFVGAGQNYRPGPDAVRLAPEKADVHTARSSPLPTPFARTGSIDNFIGDIGGHSKLIKSLVIGGGVGLLAVLGVGEWKSSRRPAWEAARPAAVEQVDPVRKAFEDAKRLAAAGDLDGAHARVAASLAGSSLRETPEVRDIESRWADALLGRADRETDVAARRTLLSTVAQATTVDAARRRNAAEKLKDADYLGTDVHRLPQASKPAAANAPSATEATTARPVSRPVLAADPWAPTPTARRRDDAR
jgi:pSer/pThr/pTyr-binding forkhead associated (FHA) protein